MSEECRRAGVVMMLRDAIALPLCRRQRVKVLKEAITQTRCFPAALWFISYLAGGDAGASRRSKTPRR